MAEAPVHVLLVKIKNADQSVCAHSNGGLMIFNLATCNVELTNKGGNT
jgi:hypothetical protein